MKKIGILTTFDELNPGAFLQAYSLFKVLNSFGCSPILIHHKTFSYFLKEMKIYFIKFLSLKRNIIKYYKFRNSINKLQKTPLFFSCNKLNNYLKENQINNIILGSDEIWNFKNAIGANIPAFWGYGLDVENILTYAVSFGSVSIDDNFPYYVIKGLKKIKSFLVRDENTKWILKKKFNIESELVLDPTFLWEDFDEDNNFNSFSKSKLQKDYWLVYGFFDNKWGKEILKLAKKYNVEVISIFYKNEWCCNNVLEISPFEWVNYIKNASFIITTMYHGTIFSLKYEKNFLVYITPYRLNKLNTLIHFFNLKDNVLNNSMELYEKIEKHCIKKQNYIEKISSLKKISKEKLLLSLKELRVI